MTAMREQIAKVLYQRRYGFDGEDADLFFRLHGDHPNGGGDLHLSVRECYIDADDILAIFSTRIAELEAAPEKERQRCVDIVQAARFDEVDRDWRAIISMIEGGQTVEQMKAVDATLANGGSDGQN